MTSITSQTLNELQADYHGLVSRILHASASETLLFSHFGEFNQTKVEHILKLVESAILEQGDKRQTMKRVCSVLIEVLQNMSLHSAKDSTNRMYGYCVISRAADAYHLCTGNLVLSEDVDALNERMSELTSLDKNSLRKQFIETLCNDDFTYKGGAGLGLLTIAKRAKDEVIYHVRRINQDFGYFNLETKLELI